MFESRLTRVAGIGVLLLVLAVLVIGFGMLGPAPGMGASPSVDDVAANNSVYVGGFVQVTGTIIDTDPVVVSAEYAYVSAGTRHFGTREFVILGLTREVTVGDRLQVFGTLNGARTITADNVVVIPAQNYIYMYAVSALAGVWTLLRLLGGWRFDWTTVAIHRREKPMRWGGRLVGWLMGVVE